MTSTELAVLTRVIRPAETKAAVISIIKQMADDYATWVYMLYFLRAFDNPTIIAADMDELDKAEASAKARKKAIDDLKHKILYSVLALGAGGIAYLLGQLG